MAKMSIKDALEKFKGSENNEFFTLKDDGNSAVVRFLYDVDSPEADYSEIDAYPVHEVTINGKKRYILCTEEDNCKGCIRLGKPVLKMFAQLIDDRDGKIKTWERGRNFIKDFVGLIEDNGMISSRKYEIVRKGKAGDQYTKYEIFPLEVDGATYEDISEDGKIVKQEFVGRKGFVLERTADEFEKIITTGKDPVAEADAVAGATPRAAGGGEDVF